MVRGQYEAAQRFADRLLDLAERSKDPAELLIAHTMMGINLFWKGDLTIAHDHFERAAERFDPPHQRHLTALYGMDVATDCSGYAALPLWMMGYPDQALERSEQALSLARERDHLSTSAMSLCHASIVYLLRRDSQRAQELAKSGLALSEEHGFGL
jgi:tetratricopeptide (TPR) repeat protein